MNDINDLTFNTLVKHDDTKASRRVLLTNPDGNDASLATQSTLEDVLTELEDVNTGLITNNPFNGYGLYAWSDDGTTLYAIYQNTSGAWIMKKMVNATGVLTYSKGSSDASTAWTNKATQTYADYDTTFS